MSNTHTQTARLRFVYTYHQVAPVETYDHIQDKLAQHCLDHLRSLNGLEGGAYYAWECHPDAVKTHSELVEVSVHFVSRHDRNSSGICPLQARQLWNALVEQYDCETSRTLFGGRMYSMNMRPVDVETAGVRNALTFGRLMESIPITMDQKMDVEDVAKPSTSDCVVLAVDTFLHILQNGSRAAALYTAPLQSFLALANTPASNPNERDVIPMQYLKPDVDYHNTSTMESPPSLYKIAQLICESKGSLSLATASQYVGNLPPQSIALWIAKVASDARVQIQPYLHGGTTEETLAKIVETTDALRVMFQYSHRATIARVRHCLEMDVSSVDKYNEAIQSIARLQTLARYLDEGSKSLTTILETRRKLRNTKLGTLLGTAATTAAIGVMCPPGLAAVGAAYLGAGVATGSAYFLSHKWFEESSQSETLIQSRGHIDKVHQKLFFHTVACFVTEIWGFDLQTMPPADKERFLEKFGVHPDYLYSSDYTKAHLRAALEEVEKAHDGLMYDIEGVFMDLGMITHNVEQVTTRQAAQPSAVIPDETTAKKIEELEELEEIHT